MQRRNFLTATSAALLLPTAARAAEDVPLLTFGLIADAQYADVDPQGERHYRATLPKLQTAVDDLNQAKVAFTLHLGDLIDRDFASYGKILPYFEKATAPIHHILGNHDYTVADADKARVVDTLGMPHDYYTFRSGKVRFVMLDTNAVSTYKHPANSAAAREGVAALATAKSNNAPGAQSWNGAVDETQLAWLERELTAADAAGEIVLVVGHHPLRPDDSHALWNPGAVLPVLQKHACVKAYLNGHNHKGAFAREGALPCITFRSMLHEPNVNAWSVVQVYVDRLVIAGRGREVSQTVKFGAV